MDLAEQIKSRALELGFDLVGITDASPVDDQQVEILRRWLAAGCAGQMTYLHRNLEKRINPAHLLRGARSVICVAVNYKPAKHPPAKPSAPTGTVATYACCRDYHFLIKKLLCELAGFIASEVGSNPRFKICVDSAPVAEKALACRAGLGFVGRNHLLTSPQLGSQLLLGEIITDLELPADEPVEPGCGDCANCIDACPTGALQADGWFDARKCISYLTIEHRGPIAGELAARMGDHLFGCDRCILACPYTRRAPAAGNAQLAYCPDRAALSLQEVLAMDEEAFNRKFAGSVIRRVGLQRLRRNASICLVNAGNRKEIGR